LKNKRFEVISRSRMPRFSGDSLRMLAASARIQPEPLWRRNVRSTRSE
jgi:hypothetical protein